ncbi:MAG: VWA domain-containing protein [Puniceicoccales bacterium]|jgi:Ca-activated chloride channel family protein|nr:VWA domain-containing protein [Puniceicoccales bacterium]
MISFEFYSPQYLWFLFLLPLALYLQKKCHRTATVKFSHLEFFKKATGQHLKRDKLLKMLRFFALVSMIIALARPQRILRSSETNSNGIDIMLAIDISSSMMGLDFQEQKEQKLTTRLDIAKQLTKEFIQSRPNDRMGMCAFAGAPYLVSPVTLNHEWLVENLERLHINLVEDGTAIGNTIAMCANRLKNSEAKTKIIVLLTDGSNTAGNIAPLIATETAAVLNIRIYTIGIGKQGVVNFAYPDEHGNVVTDPFGQPMILQATASIDEPLLEKIAETTHGQFFRAENKKQLAEIYRTIDQLEKSDVKIKQYAIAEDFFLWFIGLALLLLLLECLLCNTKFQRIP